MLQNGRANLAATAAAAGRGRRAVRRELQHWADHAGRDGAYHGFWRRRAAEALTGLAADLLRERGRLWLAPRPRPTPAPDHRLRRLRRVASRFVVQPGTLDERRRLRRWTKAPRLGPEAPRQLLEDAVALAPHDTAAWLWLFEACLDADDRSGAAHALRQARRLAEPERMPLLLARARLLEARGRWPAATRTASCSSSAASRQTRTSSNTAALCPTAKSRHSAPPPTRVCGSSSRRRARS
jgi:hypothetical protein